MSFKERLNTILSKYDALQKKLSSGDSLSSKEFVQASKELADLDEIVELIRGFNKASVDLRGLEEMMQDPSADKDIKDMAEEEYHDLKKDIHEIEDKIKIALIPKDEADQKNAIIEIRAGTGGDEAALFAATLFEMYQRYASLKGWNFEVLEKSDTGIGGIKEGSAVISGKNVFARLKFESGVHRVQRVPETESSGRVHTSAATVAVLPEAEEFDVDIQEKDLRIDVFRASGAGGQHVNTTDSAVRVTHLPTGIVVSQQDEKSQHKNKAKALKILRSRIYEAERGRRDAERSASRKQQVGSGDRSERIRTYNFPQGRVTDHRINLTLYKINEIVAEGKLDEVIEPLIAEDEALKLANSESSIA
ncbi:MAG: peptide chain release factor 1 [Rickettsiales bacterium]